MQKICCKKLLTGATGYHVRTGSMDALAKQAMEHTGPDGLSSWNQGRLLPPLVLLYLEQLPVLEG